MKNKIIITGGSGFIGTNLVQFYLNEGWEVLNLDNRSPRNPAHGSLFHKTDLLEASTLNHVINGFNPNYIIHMAARTDLGESSEIRGYDANIQGVRNIITACNNLFNLKRVIFASSMLVCKPGDVPKDEADYTPDTLYGESKVLTEKIIRESNISCEWLIVRPTSIWGPWFDVPYKNFFNAVLNKRYCHPGKRAGTATYGFIGNTVYQINQLLTANKNSVQQKTFYLGDSPPNNLAEWADEIALSADMNKNITVPYWIIKVAALCGDLLVKANIAFPISSFRLKNMTTNNIIDLSETDSLAPNLPYSRSEGVQETLKWIANAN